MNRLSTSLGAAALIAGCLALAAEDFQPLMKVTQATWPEKQHIGVICDYRDNQAEIWALAKAAGSGALITVADTRSTGLANVAATLLANHKADYVVLMPQDRLFRDGTFGASLALSQLAMRGVPAIGTSPAALRQGAVFSLGDGTEGQLLVTDKLIGTISVDLPGPARISQKSSLILQREGMATIAVSPAE